MSVSREVKRQRREEWRVGTRRAVAALEADGVCWADWARARGFSAHAVKDVVRDRNPATRGELFEVAARIRDEAATKTAEGVTPPGLAQATAKMIHDCANAQAALGFCTVLLSDLLHFGYIPAHEIDRARLALSLARSFSGGAMSGTGRPAIPPAAETEDPA